MRKIAMLTTALMGLALVDPAFAQQNAAPVSGLPPGASVGAPNAQPPAATGDLQTTRVGPATVAPRVVRARRPRPVRRSFFRRRAATPAPAAQ